MNKLARKLSCMVVFAGALLAGFNTVARAETDVVEGPNFRGIRISNGLLQNTTFYVSSGTVTDLSVWTLRFRDGTTMTTASGGGGGGTPGGSNKQIQYNNSGSFAGGPYWDSSNLYVGIGTNTPRAPVHVAATQNEMFRFERDFVGSNRAALIGLYQTGSLTEFYEFGYYGSGGAGFGADTHFRFVRPFSFNENYGDGLRLYNYAGTQYEAIQASTTVTSSMTMVLPSVAGTVGQVRTISNVQTDGGASYIYENWQTLVASSEAYHSVGIDQINASGSPTASTFLRGDGQWATPAGGGGASTLAVGTGTLTNFTTNVTSPTSAISFFGTQFKSLAKGTTNVVYIDTSSSTGLLPKDVAASTYLNKGADSYVAGITAADTSVTVTGGSGVGSNPTVALNPTNSYYDSVTWGDGSDIVWTLNSNTITSTKSPDNRFVIGAGTNLVTQDTGRFIISSSLSRNGPAYIDSNYAIIGQAITLSGGDVTGTLGTGNGGTGQTAWRLRAVPFMRSTTQMESSSATYNPSTREFDLSSGTIKVGTFTITTLLPGVLKINTSSTVYSALISPSTDMAAGVFPNTVVISSGGVGAISATTGLTGTLAAAQFPALTGDVTTSAGSLNTTVVRLNSNAITPDSTTYARLNSTQTFSAAQTFSSSVTFISSVSVAGVMFGSNGVGTNGQVWTSAGPGLAPSWTTISSGGGGGSSTLAVGTGTLTNFTNNVTSPTAALSFYGVYFKSLAVGTTNVIYLETTSATGVLTTDNVQTLTNKTFDANATGNVLAWTDFMEWNNTDGIFAGTTYYATLSTVSAYGHLIFAGSNSTSTCGGYVLGHLPADFDTTGSMTMILSDYSGNDASSRTYIVSVATFGTTMNVSTMAYSTPITISMSSVTVGQTSGFSRNFTSASATLTGWPALLTADGDFAIAIRRQGDSATLDVSTIDSYFARLIIRYPRKQ